jgi:hypothetical protein
MTPRWALRGARRATDLYALGRFDDPEAEPVARPQVSVIGDPEGALREMQV